MKLELGKCSSKKVKVKKIKLLLLLETPAGFALFKLLDDVKLYQAEDLSHDFSTTDSARQIVKLKAFSKFDNVSEALSETMSLIDGKPSKGLANFLRDHFKGDMLGVSDHSLGYTISRNLHIKCLFNTPVLELIRGVRTLLPDLIYAGLDLNPLALSHSLSSYKLELTPDDDKSYSPVADSVIGEAEVSTENEKKNTQIEDEVPASEDKPRKKKRVDAQETAQPNDTEKKEKKKQLNAADGEKKRKCREADREKEQLSVRA